MALSATSSCTQTVTGMAVPDPKASASQGKAQAGGVLPLPVKPRFQRSALRRTKSRKPVKTTKVSASVQEAGSVVADQTADSVISQAVIKVGDEIATTSGEILDAVDAVIEEGPAAMRVRKSAGKSNSRTSRRRALVMCLALGMVRPCASNVASDLQSSTDLRRTASAMPALTRTASSPFKAPTALVSQVSLATTLKQTNLLGEQEDLQKLTTLQ